MSNNDKVRVRGVQVHRPIVYGNTATVLTAKEKENAPPEHTHKWTVAVRSAASAPDSGIVGGKDDISHFIRRVSFKLHETYPNPTRSIDKPPFEVTETGWGEFEIAIRITFVSESNEKALTIYHHLKLHPWTASGDPEIPELELAIKLGPVHSWQYDEIVFCDPYQSFLNILTSHPPTPLPKGRVGKRAVPFHLANLGEKALEESRGQPGVPEFHLGMEKEEQARLYNAQKTIWAEVEKMNGVLKQKLIEKNQLQKNVNALPQ
ncbi:yeats family protein [Flagelloscypha sp. PMI_526]|nr:yeats family protein [Flagelloscypha sp. PMI_526]